MGTYIARRLVLMIPTLIGITFLVFMLVALAPGGIGAALKVQQGGVLLSQQSAALQQAYLEDRYGLDDPAIVQYVRWLGRICPIKLGARDQVAPSGDLVRIPRALKRPPLWRWFVPKLPEPGAGKEVDAGATSEVKIDAFRAAERAYADARREYTGSVALLRQALGRYAVEVGLARAVDREGRARPEMLSGHEPVRTASGWGEAQELGEKTVAAYSRAMQAEADLVGAFRARPYPEDGTGIRGVPVSLALPDLGVAYSRQRPVRELIATALPVTLLLNLVAFPIIYAVAIPSGMLAATKRGTAVDWGLGTGYIVLWSIPVVLASVLSIGFLASKEFVGAFPVSGLHSSAAREMRFLPSQAEGVFEPGFVLDTLWHLCLPVMCLVYTGFAILSKQTRAAMLENFSADYVRTAKAKGVAPKDVVFRHVFRNSLLPLITMFVTIFPAMLAGSVVVEKVFTIPGMGSMILEAIVLRDRELLLANTLIIAMVNLLALLLADILYAMADPRVSYE